MLGKELIPQSTLYSKAWRASAISDGRQKERRHRGSCNAKQMMPLGADMAKGTRSSEGLFAERHIGDRICSCLSILLCGKRDWRFVLQLGQACETVGPDLYKCQASSTVAKLSLSRRGSLFSLHISRAWIGYRTCARGYHVLSAHNDYVLQIGQRKAEEPSQASNKETCIAKR